MQANNLKTFNNKRVLITGAGGFIGHYLAEALAADGAIVSILDRNPAQQLFVGKEYIGDIKEVGFVDACIEDSNPEIIFHLAAFKERSSAAEAFLPAIETNLIGSLHLFTAAKKLPALQRIVVIGTAEEYGRNECPFVENMRESPVSAYSLSKLCLTHLCETLHALYKLPITVIRPSLAYGPGQDTDMFLPALIKSLIKNKPFPMTPGRQTRDFIYITDLVSAIVNAAGCGSSIDGQIINLGSGQPVTIASLALQVEKLLDKSGLVKIGEIDYRPGEVMEYYIDNSKARGLLNWSPKVGLEEGLRRTINFYLRGD